MDQIEVGGKIKEFRKKEKLTQEQLAKKLGISKMSMRRYENGERMPSVDVLIRLANIFKVKITDIYSYELESYKEQIIEETPILRVAKKNGSTLFTDEVLNHRIIDNLNITSDKQLLLLKYNQLNNAGQTKAMEQIELLTKIPEYRKDQE